MSWPWVSPDAQWPPQLDALKRDLGIEANDTRDDGALQEMLDAAVAWVQEQRRGDLNFEGHPDSLLPAPPASVRLGTVRLAGRWHTRRRSPDGLVDLGSELGSSRVPTVDPDIERQLAVGRFRNPMI